MHNFYLRIFYFFCFVFFSLSANSQTMEEHLTNQREKYKLEKISIHTDKTYYIAGDTIWFKAYVMADANPSMESSKISISLVNDSNRTISKLILPVLLSSTSGSIQLPSTLATGTYSIQAFTNSMAVRNKENFYNRNIEIVNIYEAAVKKEIELKPKLEFFPESGTAIEGIYNTIAFKCTDQFGYPLEGKGNIINAAGEEIHSFYTSHDGMGKIRMKPLTGETYNANVIFDNGLTKSYILPKATLSGIGFETSINAEDIFTEINSTRIANENWRPAYMLITQNNFLIAKNDLPRKDIINVRIPTVDLFTGILKVSIFSAENKPLIERLFFINNDNYKIDGNFSVVKKSLQTGGKNTYEIRVQDTTNTNLSVAVVDAAYDTTTNAMNNIVSDLLLSEELKGYIHDPSQYFLQNDILTKRKADLVMMTNGWRRFNWEKILQGSLPNYPATNDDYLNFAGRVFNKTTNRPMENGYILALFKNKKDGAGTVNVPFNKEGKFLVKDFVVHDTLGIEIMSLYDEKGKKIDMGTMGMEITSMPVSAGLTISPLATLKQRTQYILPDARRRFYEANAFGKEITLQGIKVEANVKERKEQDVNDRYTSNSLFRTGETRSYDFISEPLTGNVSQNLLSYAPARFTGVKVSNSNGKAIFVFRNIMSLSSGNLAMTIVVDNVAADVDLLRTIQMKDVALVKIYSNNLLFTSDPGGVMAIFTKKGSDYAKLGAPTKNVTINLEGYSYIKEFYSPDDLAIEKARINKIPDNRTTIYWNPSLELDGNNVSKTFSFYNSDAAKKHRVIIQGFNSAGKLFYLEKIIE